MRRLNLKSLGNFVLIPRVLSAWLLRMVLCGLAILVCSVTPLESKACVCRPRSVSYVGSAECVVAWYVVSKARVPVPAADASGLHGLVSLEVSKRTSRGPACLVADIDATDCSFGSFDDGHIADFDVLVLLSCADDFVVGDDGCYVLNACAPAVAIVGGGGRRQHLWAIAMVYVRTLFAL
jgi:hypothetical protein